MLVDAPYQGKPRKLLVEANRNGFLYILDRVDGTIGVAGAAHAKRVMDALERRALLLRPGDRAIAGERFDTTDAGCDAALRHDDEQPDVPGRAHVGAAAQLDAEARDADHPYTIAVLLAEERRRSGGDRVRGGVDLGRHRHIAINLFVDDPLDAIEIGARHRMEVDEVEAEPIRRDEGSFLLHVRAEHLAERRVEEMGRRVVPARSVADLRIDLRRDEVAGAQRS